MSEFRKLLGWLFTERGNGIGLLILRMTVGIFMMTHGLAKIRNFNELSLMFADPVGLGPQLSVILMIFAEFCCSILVILGVLTRLAVIPLIIGMSVAAFIAHSPFSFGGSETALLYLVVFVSLLFSGAGRYSFDHLIGEWISK